MNSKSQTMNNVQNAIHMNNESTQLKTIEEALKLFPSGAVRAALLKEREEILGKKMEVKEFAEMVGKTDATKEFIEICCDHGVPVVVSCDNKTDQMDQLYTRIANDLESYDDLVLLKVSDRKFGKSFETAFKEKKNVVVFCLDNAIQLTRVKQQFALQMTLEKTKINKIALISDEGDVITKDFNIEEIEDEQCASHKEWIRMTTFFNESGVDVKRVFVTATPENVVFKYKVEHILRLDIPKNYVGYKDINYIEMDPKTIKDVLIKEQNRRLTSGENGVILYCVDKKIQLGQDPTFVSVCSYLKRCVVNTYNGNGITARVLNKRRFETALRRFVELHNKVHTDKKITYSDESTIETKNVWHIKNMAIRDFYQICKDIGTKVIVTIGMDLIARGISFVSSEKTRDALAATTMIYRPGATLHAVALCQAIGRITGVARPDLERRLYAPKDVIETYKNYNINQQQYLAEIEDLNGKVTSEVMEKVELNKKLSRPLDRTKLGLKPNYAPEPRPDTNDVNRMRELVDMWWGADTIIGKVLRFVYESEVGVSELELQEFIKKMGSKDPYQMYIHLTRQDKEYNHLFERTENKITKLRLEAREYIAEKKV